MTFAPFSRRNPLGMPEVNGYDVMHRFREQPELKGAYIVALTGYNDRERALEAGFDLHLLKPVLSKELKLVLETYRAGEGPQRTAVGPSAAPMSL